MNSRNRNASPSRWFEDFSLGEVYALPSRTQTGGLFAMFQARRATTTRSITMRNTAGARPS